MSNTEIRNINFVVPKNATNVTIMFQLPDESSIQKVVVEKKVMSDTANLSKTQQVIAAVERYPSMRIESVAHMTGLSRTYIGNVKAILKYGIPELQEMLRNEETNITYLYRFMTHLSEDDQRELIKKYGVYAVKNFNQYFGKERGYYTSRRNNTTINVL